MVHLLGKNFASFLCPFPLGYIEKDAQLIGAQSISQFFLCDALKKLNRIAEANKILNPILKSISEGNFSGRCEGGNSKDWKTWKGECWGYEGFLVDNYLVLLACLNEKERG